jgi:hypothetical protein
MLRRLCAVPVVAVTITAGVLTSPAIASESVSAGVARARAAGIHVSAAAAKLMARAPAGTCMANPTARRCPAVKRIVAVAAAATGCRALASEPSLASHTRAYGPGYSANCGSNTVYNEITTTLLRYTDSRTWQQLDTAITSRNGAGDVGATAWFTCRTTQTPVYLFRTKAVSYSKNRSGTAYMTSTSVDKLLACK